ncbi:LEM3/CDC50 family protein, putative [Plasmodium ovale]|uniref:LEM3/CDC50 family protein, putative n=2 Tax=Plasmodium ovale TaxID=36330 RepID=A0A1A8VYC2_PLAOA|nr:LEM3/CDC50 family protein, putative [Plasmodium ovale curtisi]SBS91571.1 LEM3/CDC50 family protein, putative [Plasmodium ovale curtisi]SCP04660.1 LEM3/CDC50 family protein, putative [Plasmodium ovale]
MHLNRKNEISKKKGKLYYKKTSQFVRRLYKFVQWYRMERAVGPVWVHKYSSVIAFLLFLFLFNLLVGILILILSSKYIECRIPYEYKTKSYTKYSIVKVTPEHCKGKESLRELKGQINIHYEIYGVQQNHSRFITSFKKEQLSGKVFLKKEDLNECYPLITYEQDGVNKILHPCGILQWNVFTDSYIFYDREPDDAPFPIPLPLKQKAEDITIKFYRNFFKNPNPSLVDLYKKQVYFWMDEDTQSTILQENVETNEKLVVLPQTLKYKKAGKALENSHFINWMIPSAFNYIKRLYAKLDGPLPFPFYIYVENNFKISDTKTIVVSSSDFYLSITLIGILFIMTAIFAFILSVLYFIRMKKYQFK